MSKSGNYNLGEIENRDALIQELCEPLEYALPLVKAMHVPAIENICNDAIAKVRNP